MIQTLDRFHAYVMAIMAGSFSLAETRVLLELAGQDGCEVRNVRQRLRFDPGHLSRVLARLDTAGLVVRERSGDDQRCLLVRLTHRGRDALGDNERTLSDDDRARIIAAVRAVGGPAGEERRLRSSAAGRSPQRR
ncbi:MarR family winged helix-turn-helix transcriptional regulator [Nonomuraea dietziae]|uniref:DNA-binding MarR family transcriptional regulator n=1 Tax=Nonomuraea dietziae TaxID=65515 RepID=A0A7W5Y5H8_9ACTN|nr:MarR family winged helix-turn-helix transcriptional regulator [Nonomuraea dietziae]MBB3725013.1 DNA-binding MarR family transcriptional regulator [Nonomuraea dietziae]